MYRLWTILLIAFGFMMSGCSTGRITSLNLNPDEAIIIAKIQIKNGDSYLNNKWNFLLDERLWAKWAVWPDEQNFIYMKVPIGKHFIALVQYSSFRKNLPDNYLTIDIKENKIYYIGDIVLHWTIDKEKDVANYNGGGAVGGAATAISDSKIPGEYIKVDIIDNYDETTKYFTSKFPSSQLIEKELLKINK
jgi:hypothetical protein